MSELWICTGRAISQDPTFSNCNINQLSPLLLLHLHLQLDLLLLPHHLGVHLHLHLRLHEGRSTSSSICCKGRRRRPCKLLLLLLHEIWGQRWRGPRVDDCRRRGPHVGALHGRWHVKKSRLTRDEGPGSVRGLPSST